jgi:hypothetical protein
MSFLMSGAITAINVGMPAGFLGLWMHAWAYAFSIALPVILVVAPLVRHLTGRLVEAPETSAPLPVNAECR